jgi:pimeloyl-ACP methyl ester carboxylesterase
MRTLFYTIAAAATLAGPLSTSAFAASYGQELEGFAYPHPLHHFSFASQGQNLQMAYMDVAPTGAANGRTAVLLHGKNFCGATWEQSITALSAAGYRVVAPDQIGFCASTKPEHYQYSFQQLAANTDALLKHIGVKQAALVAHSTGGMLATRYALMYPDAVSRLVLVNPIGLEDWKALGVPSRSVDQWYERELKLSPDSVRAYEKSTYYVNRWKPEYERWVDMLAGLNAGPGHKLVAWNSAMIGDADPTAIGSDIAPPAVKARIGRYDVLGKQAAKLIPQGRLVEFKGLGHAPQMEDPAAFHRALLEELAR